MSVILIGIIIYMGASAYSTVRIAYIKGHKELGWCVVGLIFGFFGPAIVLGIPPTMEAQSKYKANRNKVSFLTIIPVITVVIVIFIFKISLLFS